MVTGPGLAITSLPPLGDDNVSLSSVDQVRAEDTTMCPTICAGSSRACREPSLPPVLLLKSLPPVKQKYFLPKPGNYVLNKAGCFKY